MDNIEQMNRREFIFNSTLLGAGVLSFSVQGEEVAADNCAVKMIILTIDDGPRKTMVEILEKLGVQPVIFYIVGNITGSGAGFVLACQALEQGHWLGNHSWSHPLFSQISFEQGKAEIEKSDTLIEKIYQAAGISRQAKLFRFPYGDPGDGTFADCSSPRNDKRAKWAEFLVSLGYQTQFWDVDSNDWRYYSKKAPWSLAKILNNCRQAQDGDVVLVHDLPVTVREIIPYYLDLSQYRLMLPIKTEKAM